MPTYQYECGSCGHGFEIFQSITASKLKKCPECGKLKLYRLIGTGGGIIFKGTGFYETDYKKKAPAENTAKSESTKESTKDTSKKNEKSAASNSSKAEKSTDN